MNNTDPLRIAIFGASGRLGTAIAKLALDDPRFEVVSLLVHPRSSSLGSQMGPLPFSSALGDSPDVLIDVSIAAAFPERLQLALDRTLPLVLGTTGLSDHDHALIQHASAQIPIFHAANFSIGMALLRRAAAELARRFSPAQIGIEETHHTQKKDAPSGSALFLAAALQEALPHLTSIPIRSIRSGNVIGEHTIALNGPTETVTLSHTVLNRDTFANGALAAALFLKSRPPGLYSMDDL